MEWVRILRRLRALPAYSTDPTFRAYVQSWGIEAEHMEARQKSTNGSKQAFTAKESPEDFLFRLIQMQCDDRARLIQQHLTTLQQTTRILPHVDQRPPARR